MFDDVMNKAFENLARFQACPGHKWTEPKLETWREGKRLRSVWSTRCRLCQGRASRPDRERLIAEVIDN